MPKKYQKYKPEYLAMGKRGVIFKFTKNKKEYIIKVKRESSEAQNRIENEGNFLKLLNKHKIGPKLIEYDRDHLVMEFIKGKLIKEYKKIPNNILKQVLKQCYILDTLKINKFEMHKPLKHIIIYRNKVTMIDFERCTYTDKPKNVTQFCEYINRNKKRIKKSLLQEYKKDMSKKNFEKLTNALS